MGCIQNCVCCHRNRQLIIPLIFLLISGLTNARFMVEDRAISKLVESASLTDYTPKEREEEMVVVARKLIGSRPPRCERRCSSCGHCEAIQVPFVPQHKSHATARTNHYPLSATPTIASSRGDDISNYKPMGWKCKCGDFIFNP